MNGCVKMSKCHQLNTPIFAVSITQLHWKAVANWSKSAAWGQGQ